MPDLLQSHGLQVMLLSKYSRAGQVVCHRQLANWFGLSLHATPGGLLRSAPLSNLPALCAQQFDTPLAVPSASF